MIQPMNLVSPKGVAALAIVKRLRDSHHEALFAGGCVRDHLLGSIPTDYDIATSATPEQVEKLFPKTVPVGRQFGVMLVIEKEMQFEVATFRTEGGYQDGRHPGFVRFSNAKEDASRRDFTVNGLFYDPLQHQVLDFVNGQADIQSKVIRCIGDPAKRFEEDKLRLLRAVRFAVRLGFLIEDGTKHEIQKQAARITAVSLERIRDEIDKILTSACARAGLDLLIELGLWQTLWPSLPHDNIVGRFAKLDQADKLTSALANAVFSYGRERQMIEEEMRRFRYSNETIQQTLRILELTGKLKNFSALREGEKRILVADSCFASALWLYSKVLSQAQSAIEIQNQANVWRGETLPAACLNGEDLKGVGVLPGPKMGLVLQEAYLLQLEGKLKDKAQALNWAKTQI